ncbi:hypothetical protein KVR01_010135 [Diaporthe batatas]|uniref:uncharacterized protein n=1 Tax=Diaporthe batatas TaxID=748121 RepID=UPI001D0486AD|nr:uncharacterized protein KVR01_010135 [Diaporthe batatas]KAG8159498.1 hypothetical protein KVR01_010135 [Diaporthe batatas]
MEANDTSIAAQHVGFALARGETPRESKTNLHVDIPDVNKTMNSTQEITSGEEKTAVESSKDDTQKNDSAKNEEEKEDAKMREVWEENRKKLARKAAVKWSDYEHFKNRYSPEDGLEIIEVLYGHPDLGGEIAQEKAQRASTTANFSRKSPSRDNRWIQRVRIESGVLVPLLAHLSSCEAASHIWPSERPRVFFRPFVTFYHTLPLMKKCIQILENSGHTPSDRGVTPNLPGDIPIIDSFSGTNITQTLFALDPEVALPQLRVYVEFVEKNIIPMWDEAAGTSKQRARWCDLPMFFRPGELLFTNLGTANQKGQSQPGSQAQSGGKHTIQNIWKFISLFVTEVEDAEPSDYRNTKRNLSIRAYHIDFDGDKFGPSECEWPYIPEYSGEKEIRSLYVYPLRYEKERERMEAELCKRGKRFLPLLRERHCYYDGWSIRYCKAIWDLDSTAPNAEYIDGEIMIDFKEGCRANPELTAFVHNDYDMDAFHWFDREDPIEIKFWDGPARLKLLGESRDISQTEEDFTKRYELTLLKHDPFIRDHNENKPWLQEYTTDLTSHFHDEQYILLPQRLIAYSFRGRKFFMANVDCVSPMALTKNSFRDLKINPDHKRMVNSLAQSHFEKQDMRRNSKVANLDQDFIRGKGAGLIILLHGVPGVGKTTTAEAVALHNRKPLFTITSADLGFTPREVETKLVEFFRLAQIWDCVLLLDEADLFLSRREVQDLQRNALVSVFLRVLEYYNGILFLTTNRVGTMDEAFKSRIHVSLYYPPLTEAQTVDIFRVNLRRLHEIEAAKKASEAGNTIINIDDASIVNFAKRHFKIHQPSERWNGRQIRNAFQVAYSLAQFDTWETNPDDSGDDADNHEAVLVNGEKTSASRGACRMDSNHFKIVAESIERFDYYLFKTRGTDADTARNHRLRNDGHRDPRDTDYDRMSLGPDYRGGRPNSRREMPRSPSARSPVFDPVTRSSRNQHREHFDDEDEEELEDNSDIAGPDYGGHKNNPARQPFPSSHSTPSVPKSRRGGDRHYGQRGGDEYSPDDTGYGKGGSMSSGRANSYGRGRDAYEY